MKALILLLAMASPVLGRIGETSEQCHDRYSSETKPDPFATSRHYQKSGMRISPQFRNGVCVFIEYKKSGGVISNVEASQLMKANYSGEWKIHGKSWVSDNGELIATLPASAGFLYIITAEEAYARRKEKAEKEKKALEGL